MTEFIWNAQLEVGTGPLWWPGKNCLVTLQKAERSKVICNSRALKERSSPQVLKIVGSKCNVKHPNTVSALFAFWGDSWMWDYFEVESRK